MRRDIPKTRTSKTRTPKTRYRWVAIGLLALLAVVSLAKGLGSDVVSRALSPPVVSSSMGDTSAEEALLHAFETHGEAFWVEASGRVVRILADDRKGSRHQRIIVVLDTGQTLLIAHNIDVAPRLDNIAPGDSLRFRGEYVWNAQGGVIHWTHHDPQSATGGGWLELKGRRYR